jgi:hypothetical protein
LVLINLHCNGRVIGVSVECDTPAHLEDWRVVLNRCWFYQFSLSPCPRTEFAVLHPSETRYIPLLSLSENFYHFRILELLHTKRSPDFFLITNTTSKFLE